MDAQCTFIIIKKKIKSKNALFCSLIYIVNTEIFTTQKMYILYYFLINEFDFHPYEMN